MFDKPCHTKVCQSRFTSFIYKDILRTHVTMIYLFLMRSFQRISNIEYNADFICLFESFLTEFASERTFVLITAYLIIVSLLFIHSAISLDNEWRCTYLVLGKAGILNHQTQFLQFFRTLTSNIKRIFTYFITRCSNEFGNTQIFRELFSFLKNLLDKIVEDFLSFRSSAFYRLARKQVNKL